MIDRRMIAARHHTPERSQALDWARLKSPCCVDPVPCQRPYSYTGESCVVFYWSTPKKEWRRPWLAWSVRVSMAHCRCCSSGWLCLLALPAAAQPWRATAGKRAAAACCSPELVGHFCCWLPPQGYLHELQERDRTRNYLGSFIPTFF